MRGAVSGWLSAISSGGLLIITLCFVGCSIPNLEPQQCIDSRTSIREFYSQHFGNNLDFSPTALQSRSVFLTPRFLNELNSNPPATDPFTLMDDPPKAFRVSECKVNDGGVRFNVLLFWKTDERSEQRSIVVDLVNQGGKWLIDRVSK